MAKCTAMRKDDVDWKLAAEYEIIDNIYIHEREYRHYVVFYVADGEAAAIFPSKLREENVLGILIYFYQQDNRIRGLCLFFF